MRRAVGILSTATAALFVAGIAFAGEPHGLGTDPSAAASGYLGEHAMTGRITDIDKTKGRVTVDAQGEELDLHFPQSALQNLNKGDEVTVTLGIKPAGATSGTKGGTGAPGARPGDMPGTRPMDLPGTVR